MSKLLLLLSFFSIVAVAQAQTPTSPACSCTEIESLKRNISQLNAEMQQLRSQMNSLEKELLVSTIQNQLTKEEIRGEVLQSRLFELTEKEGVLQAQLEQVNAQLQPGRIESGLVGIGSVHPEELREDARRRLTNERQRIQAKLDLLRQDLQRTRSSISTTDAAIARLRAKLAAALRK
jgi:uncharacterized protein involved in exopolysaccharide biosynthesis